MRRLIVLVLLGPLLAGCVYGVADRQAYFSQYVGKTEADLVRGLGVPTRTYDTDGHHFLAFADNTTQVVPGPYGPYGYGRWGGYYGGVYPGSVIVQVCETTFEVVDGKVVGFSLRGNGCVW